MRLIFVLVIFVSLFLSILASAEDSNLLNLMPMPKDIQLNGGKFLISKDFHAGITGNPDVRIYKGATRAMRRLAGRTGIFFSQGFVLPEDSGPEYQLKINCRRPGKVVLHENESYSLKIDEQGVQLDAETDIGALRGLETLSQLLSADNSGYYFPTCVIRDEPRFPWRGLLIDAGRHFMPVDVMKRNLDGMAAVKMNVLHWHLTEDQGFRLECKTFPKLHEMGSDGLFYTHEQIKEIVSYASDLGIRVMPEFDMPGHVTSWLVGYPELASAPGPFEIIRTWGVQDPTFDPTKKETYKFLDKFYREMTQLFPDEYFHIGGDENNGKFWNANEAIQQFMKKENIPDNHALQSYFNLKILKILTKYNRKLVGWDEIFQPEMPTNIVIQSWRGRKSLFESARKGYQGILSNGYYIDLIQPTDFHYLNDPLPSDSNLTESQEAFILGGEATMWSEIVSSENVDSRIWPRTAAIAERFWSPESINNVDDMYRRLDFISLYLDELGMMHEKNYVAMLHRLANDTDITALKIFMDVIEPVKKYQRHQVTQYTSYSPLTRVVDTARPDARTARNFRKKVEVYLAGDNSVAEDLNASLALWEENHNKLIKTIVKSPILKEIEGMSEQLSKCAAIGKKLLRSLESDEKVTEGWMSATIEYFEELRNEKQEVELMILPALEKMAEEIKKRAETSWRD